MTDAPGRRLPSCAHVGPCLCAARRRLARLEQGEPARPSRRSRRPRPPRARPIPVRPVPARVAAPPVAGRRYIVFHAEPPVRGRCPACGRPLDDGGCRILKGAQLLSNNFGWVAITSARCTGTPGPHAIGLGAPIPDGGS